MTFSEPGGVRRARGFGQWRERRLRDQEPNCSRRQKHRESQPTPALAWRSRPILIELEGRLEVTLAANLAICTVDVGRTPRIAANAVRMMLLDEALVGLLYGRVV